MKISHKIAALMSLLLILASLIFSIGLYFEKKSALLRGIDEKLLEAAQFSHHLVGKDYHDRLIDGNSIPSEDYLILIDRNNRLCEESGLQYLWSLMLVDGVPVFTTSTSTSHDVKNGDHALFFDRHTNPSIYTEAFASQKIQYSSFQDRWGEGRMVLMPDRDVHGRPFLFAASVSTAEVDSLLAQTMQRSLSISLVILLLGVGVGILFARTLSQPLVQLAETTEAIAQGDLKQEVETGGSSEIASLALSISYMSSSIAAQMMALQESETKFKELAELLPEIVFETNLEGNLTYANRAAFAKFGYSREEFDAGLLLYRMLALQDRERAGGNIALIMRGEKTGGNEYTALKKDGSTFPVIIHSTPILQEGHPIGLRGVVIDITDRRRMEEEIRRAHNLESLGLLAGGIAHDFNNVLTGVTGNLTLLQYYLNKDSEEYEIASEAKQAADRTRDLTQQLMTFARGGSPVKETASIEELLRETTGLSLRGSSSKPEFHFADDLSPLDVDTGQIGQVIQNLVLNADQAMPAGGLLEISAENIELTGDDPLPLRPGSYVKITVEDRGTGISQEMLSQVFDPYFSTKETGHGLGLSIAYSIIQRHDGHITVTSEQGLGTTFEFYLPASQKPPVTAPQKERELARGAGRILLMDDEETIHRVISRTLNKLGYDVKSVYAGEEALEAYKAAMETEEPFVAVIMDLTIPGGMGGKEAIGKLNEIDPQARVIVSSGYANDPVMADFAGHGFAGKVSKPVDIENLAGTVKKVLAG